MYSLNENTGGGKEKTNFPISANVDNVKLRNVELSQRLTGLTFNFQRVVGETISFFNGDILPPKREWFTENKTNYRGEEQTPDQQYASEIRSFNGYIAHILRECGVTREEMAAISGSTVEEFLENLVNIVNPILSSRSELIYLKVCVNDKGYTCLPRYKGKGVAQSMSLGNPGHVYSEYEQRMIDQKGLEGIGETPTVVETTVVEATEDIVQSGLDF